MLFLCKLSCLEWVTVLIYITHIKLWDTNELTWLWHNLKHIYYTLFLLLLLISILVVWDVHLRTDTVNLNCITLPLLNPVYKALELLVIVPSTFKVVVIDEEFQLTLTTSSLVVTTCRRCSITNEIDITHVILPVEAIISICLIHISSMLEVIVSITICISTWNGFINKIPCLNFTTTSIHHTCYPLVHSPSKSITFLLWCLRYTTALALLLYFPYDIIKIICISISKIIHI